MEPPGGQAGGDAVWSFWITYFLPRPLGAIAGDLLTKPVAKGGLNLGTPGSSAVLPAVLPGLMAYAHVQEGGNRGERA